jgi:hypothetical protein
MAFPALASQDCKRNRAANNLLTGEAKKGESKMKSLISDAKDTIERWPNYTFEAALDAASKIHWRVEDLIGGDKHLDFSKPFLPESLARVEPLGFLSPEEKRVLNQIRGHDYLYTFGLVEEFILPFVLDQARPLLRGNGAAFRALLNFAGEESKHIYLFNSFRDFFMISF